MTQIVQGRSDEVAYLDLADPGFDVTGHEMERAREQNWYARTPGAGRSCATPRARRC
ncbi:hypothetical protein ACF3NT_05745 [Naumannella halotolerans]|uniref:hypothetical protein n=1 Tax=Naumannella halotolerans TaxID=993414 RepID=UPI001FBA4CBD|nr:hypothetical protein [Naumannella halotolerans]